MPTNEKIKIYYHPAHSVRVEYYGNQDEIRAFFRILDLWNSFGLLKTDGNEQYYLFELSKEFYTFAKGESFLYAMRRLGIDVSVKRYII